MAPKCLHAARTEGRTQRGIKMILTCQRSARHNPGPQGVRLVVPELCRGRPQLGVGFRMGTTTQTVKRSEFHTYLPAFGFPKLPEHVLTDCILHLVLLLLLPCSVKPHPRL